jgi:hypothetical protein
MPDLAAALAEALSGVLDLRGHYRTTDAPDIPCRAIEAVLAAPLRAHIEAWHGTRAESTDTTSNTKADAV